MRSASNYMRRMHVIVTFERQQRRQQRSHRVASWKRPSVWLWETVDEREKEHSDLAPAFSQSR